MEELKKLLLQADDEYLTGLSNRGTVKRGYKDLEQETPLAVWSEEEAQVTWKEASCRIRVPLGSSTCSCPSRSMCRHRIGAMIFLRRELEKEGGERENLQGEAVPGPASGAAAVSVPEPASGAAAVSVSEPASGAAAGSAPEPASAAAAEFVPEPASAAPAASASQPAAPPPAASVLRSVLEQELLAFSLAKLRQAAGTRASQTFLARIESGELPQIQEGSIVTVRFPWENTVVKLLSPIEYSTCTCHKKGLCPHKALAILAYQMEKGAISLEQLKAAEESQENWDREAISQASVSVREGIRLQLLTGLSRLSPDAEETMERLAIICHGAGLPAFSGRLRSSAFEYRQYFARSAAFDEKDLMTRLLSLYQDACRLEEAKKPEEIRYLAGTFRDTYQSMPRLHLTGVAAAPFKSKSGYEGERYYFLEMDQGRWYTWVDARPSFYEGVRRRPPGKNEHAEAPWGLNCSRERMMELEFFLIHPKAAADGRLSVSKETKSEIVGSRNLCREEVQRMVVWDYRKLLDGEKLRSREPVLVGAIRCKKGSFDTVRQRFSMEIADWEGRTLQVAVNYSPDEKNTIRALEQLGERLESRGETAVWFFGIPYLEEGRLCLYPVEYFERKSFTARGENIAVPGTDIAASGEALAAPDIPAIRRAEQCLRDIQGLLGDLFQSGLNSVQAELLAQLASLEEEAEGLGLYLAAAELGNLKQAMEAKRHQTRFDPEPALASWAGLAEYLRLGLEKTQLDLAAARLQKAEIDCEEQAAGSRTKL